MLRQSSADRFTHSTRGRLVGLLREAPRTVEELARSLRLTPNGVRVHLSALERDGLVRIEGSRPGMRKPSHVYGITTKAEVELSRAYVPLLKSVVETIAERLPAGERASLFTAAGRRLAEGLPRATGSPRARAQAAANLLRDLGGAVKVHTEDGRLSVVSSGCPLSEVVRNHPEVCNTVRSLVAEVTGVRVTEQCEHGPQPKCRFGLGKDG